MAKIQKLILSLSNQEAIQSLSWDKTLSNNFALIVAMDKVNQIKIVSESILVIEFETGELRLDIDLTKLQNIKYVN